MVRPGHIIIFILLSITAASLITFTDARGIGARRGGHHFGRRGHRRGRLPVARPTNPRDAAIANICAHTDHPAVCTEAARIYGASATVINADTMLNAQIAMASDRTKQAQTVAKKYLSGAKGMTKSVLQTCLGQYKDAVQDLKAGANAAAARDIGTANSDLSAVISYYSTCDDGFTDMKAANPLSKLNDMLTQMVSNSLAIAQLHRN